MKSPAPRSPSWPRPTATVLPVLALLLFGLLGPAVAGAEPARPDARGAVFQLSVGDVVIGTFAEVSGLGSSTEIVEFREGGDLDVVRKLPGTLRWTDVTLKRGITSGKELWRWRRLVEEGRIEEARRPGALTLIGPGGREIARWTFDNAWPARIEGASESDDRGVRATEEVVLVVENVERVL